MSLIIFWQKIEMTKSQKRSNFVEISDDVEISGDQKNSTFWDMMSKSVKLLISYDLKMSQKKKAQLLSKNIRKRAPEKPFDIRVSKY